MAALDQARAAYPEIALDESVFVERGGLAAPHASDLWLAIACERGDAKALAILEERFMPAVAEAVAALDDNSAFVDDVLQKLRTKLLAAAYAGRSPLAGWLRIVALRIAIDLGRGGRREVPIESQLLDDARSPEEQLARREHAALVERALRDVIAEQPSRTRAVLRYYYGDRVTIEELASIYGVNKSTVSRWLAAAREAILAGTRRRLARELAIPLVDVDSMLGLARSIEVSLASLLATR